MRVLRHQRTQDRDQLHRADIAYAHHLRDELIGGGAQAVGQVVARHGPCVGVRDHLDGLARGHRHETVHLQQRKESFVERIGRHRRRRQHRDLRPDAWVDDDALAGGGSDRLDHLGDVGVLEVRRDARAGGPLRGHLTRGGEAEHDRQDPCVQGRARAVEEGRGRGGSRHGCSQGRPVDYSQKTIHFTPT